MLAPDSRLSSSIDEVALRLVVPLAFRRQRSIRAKPERAPRSRNVRPGCSSSSTPAIGAYRPAQSTPVQFDRAPGEQVRPWPALRSGASCLASWTDQPVRQGDELRSSSPASPDSRSASRRMYRCSRLYRRKFARPSDASCSRRASLTHAYRHGPSPAARRPASSTAVRALRSKRVHRHNAFPAVVTIPHLKRLGTAGPMRRQTYPPADLFGRVVRTALLQRAPQAGRGLAR